MPAEEMRDFFFFFPPTFSLIKSNKKKKAKHKNKWRRDGDSFTLTFQNAPAETTSLFVFYDETKSGFI